MFGTVHLEHLEVRGWKFQLPTLTGMQHNSKQALSTSSVYMGKVTRYAVLKTVSMHTQSFSLTVSMVSFPVSIHHQ